MATTARQQTNVPDSVSGESNLPHHEHRLSLSTLEFPPGFAPILDIPKNVAFDELRLAQPILMHFDAHAVQPIVFFPIRLTVFGPGAFLPAIVVHTFNTTLAVKNIADFFRAIVWRRDVSERKGKCRTPVPIQASILRARKIPVSHKPRMAASVFSSNAQPK